MKRFFMIAMAMALMTFTTATAQDKLEIMMSGDVVSKYVWRGLDYGDVSLQPEFGIAYKGLSLTVNANAPLSDSEMDPRELDFIVGYTIGGWSFSISDYWSEFGSDEQGRYFRYNAHSTNHLFEATIGYDFGVAAVNWSTNFAGFDGVNNNGKRAYSSYLEAIVPFKLATAEWTATVGLSPFASTYYGTTGFAVTDVSVRADKAIRITDSFSLPVFAQLTANPCSQHAYMVLGVTLNVF